MFAALVFLVIILVIISSKLSAITNVIQITMGVADYSKRHLKTTRFTI